MHKKQYFLLFICFLSSQIFAMNKEDTEKNSFCIETASNFKQVQENEERETKFSQLIDEACKQIKQESNQKKVFEDFSTENMKNFKKLFQKMYKPDNSVDSSTLQTLKKAIERFKRELSKY
jgi:type I restriction-modification system DNA methylase subunit